MASRDSYSALILVGTFCLLTIGEDAAACAKGPPQRTGGRGQSTTSGADFLCVQKRPGRLAFTTRANLEFGSRTWLHVKIVDSSNLVSDASRASIASGIGRAMLLWNHICAHCVTGNLSMIQIDDEMYVDGWVAGSLRSGDLNHIVYGPPPTNAAALPPIAANKTAIYYDVLTAMLASRYGARAPLVDFERIAAGDPFLSNICGADYQKLPQLIQNIRLSLSCPADSRLIHSSPATLSLYVLDGFTSCGRTKEIVGCSADDLVVELNARDYKFEIGPGNGASFGLGSHGVDLLHVMLHEFGHWIGLPHLPSVGNIMYPSVEGSKCIDDSNVDALDSMVRGSQDRMKGKGALYYSTASVPLVGRETPN